MRAFIYFKQIDYADFWDDGVILVIRYYDGGMLNINLGLLADYEACQLWIYRGKICLIIV